MLAFVGVIVASLFILLSLAVVKLLELKVRSTPPGCPRR
jgi:hypothetical protein